ncbi:MAG: acyl-coenzyme A synthetase/AMP-(fatty) acid ligase [Candidatus Poriferisodalaceae bacterium]
MVSGNHAAEMDGIAADVDSIETVIVRDEGYKSWLGSHSATDPMIPCDPDDNYVIRHTGGTTGLPKGVGDTHRKWLVAGRDW